MYVYINKYVICQCLPISSNIQYILLKSNHESCDMFDCFTYLEGPPCIVTFSDHSLFNTNFSNSIVAIHWVCWIFSSPPNRPAISWLNYTLITIYDTLYIYIYIPQICGRKNDTHKYPTTVCHHLLTASFPRPLATLRPPFHPSRLLAPVHLRLFQSTSGHESRK